jgi:D-alanine transfer protein
MSSARTGAPHLFSGIIAVGVAATILFVGRMIAIHLEHKTLHTVAPREFQLKNQGLAFQRAAARAPDVLPLYGSSELLIPLPERADVFFRNAPTGFQVCPVGKVGATPLIMLQKLAALGCDLRGKKLAISLSPVWFLADITRFSYEANFSAFTASELIFNSALDFELKRAIASRMLQFPRTTEKNPLLGFALGRMASGGPLDRIVLSALWPLGKVETTILDLQDHFAAVTYLLHEPKFAVSLHPQTLDWSDLIAKASETAGAREKQAGAASGSEQQTVPRRDDAWFLRNLNQSNQWRDLELLLLVLTKVHAQPLLLSMPMDGQFYDKAGVCRSVRECYYNKMRALAERYHFALVEFERHDEDGPFLNRRVPRIKQVASAHLTAKGWMFYDRVLDNFFHGREPGS